jgi:hypothetical protein
MDRRPLMTERREHRYEVTFTVSEALDGRPIITLALDQEGQTAAGQDHVFFLELDRAIDPAATSRIAAFLGQYIKGFGVMARTSQMTQNPNEPDSENGTSVLRPDALEEEAVRSDEPQRNAKEDGQPTSPPQIDGLSEVEAEEPHSQSEKAESPARTEEGQ